MEIMRPEGHIMLPEGCIMPPEGCRRPEVFAANKSNPWAMSRSHLLDSYLLLLIGSTDNGYVFGQSQPKVDP